MLTARFTERDLKHLNTILKLLTDTNIYLKSSVLACDLTAVQDFRDDFKKRLYGSDVESDEYNQSLNHFLTGTY